MAAPEEAGRDQLFLHLLRLRAPSRFRVSGLGFGVYLGFGVWGLGFRVQGSGFGVWGLFRVWGLGFGV